MLKLADIIHRSIVAIPYNAIGGEEDEDRRS